MPATERDQALSLKVLPQLPLAWEVQDFLADCKARGLSPNTLRIYRQNLRAFQGWTTRLEAQDVTAQDLRSFLAHLQEQGHNPGGVHQAYRVLKTFFRYLTAEGEIDADPMQRVRPPKLPQQPLEPVPLRDLQAMLQTCERKTFVGDRDRAILLALLDSGCRASEFLALNVGDVDLDTGAVLVRRGKGGKARSVFLGAKTRREVVRYLRHRPDAGPSDPLWVTVGGQRLTYAGLRQVVRRRAELAGVAVPSLHGFRRAFALARIHMSPLLRS